MPDNLKASIEYMSGISLADVRVEYNSDKPAQMGAYAYTQGNIIYIAPGQEKHLAHEVWHIVQQREGKVKKNTEFKKGVAGNDSKQLEGDADTQGKKAKQMAKIPDLLPQKELENKPTSEEIVQRAKIEKSSHYGKFSVDAAAYDFTANKKALNANITFEPGENTDATKIGLVQTIKDEKNGNKNSIDPANAGRQTADGIAIDRLSSRNTPVYGSPSLAAGQDLEDTPQDNNSTADPTKLEPGADKNASYELGHHHKINPADADWEAKNAGLFDGPTIQGNANSKKEFETTAVALDGTQKGEYYGSVKWGWEKDAANTLTKIPFELVSEGVPSKGFMEAAQEWNDSTVRGTAVIKANDTPIINMALVEQFKLQQGDEVTQQGTLGSNAKTYISFVVKTSPADATLVGQVGIAEVAQLEDKGDGADTLDLSIPDIKVPTEDDLQFGAEKDRSLPLDISIQKTTRLKIIEEDGDMAKVEIVQGPKTGDQGWVEKSKLTDE